MSTGIESELASRLDASIVEIKQLNKQLAKANERVEELEQEVATVKRTYNQLFDEMLKEQERNRELSQNQLLTENGKNRYGLDVSYFRNVINRELNKPLANHKPDELARVFARLSRTADESVMFEPEFSNKFALEQKIEAFEKAEIPRRAKAGCIGEFNFTIEDGVCCPECWNEQSDDCHMCNGNSNESGLSDLTATVPWDLCKSIWLRMNKIYAEQLRKEQEK